MKNCLSFASQKKNPTSLFSIDFFSFLLIFEAVTKKYVIARAKRKRSPLVRGHHWLPASIDFMMLLVKIQFSESLHTLTPFIASVYEYKGHHAVVLVKEKYVDLI